MAEDKYLNGEGLQQVVTWLREKDVGEHQENYYTSEIFNDYENNKALGQYNHVEGSNNIIGEYKDGKIYGFAGNPVYLIPTNTNLIYISNLETNLYSIYPNTEQFNLQEIELPQEFSVAEYNTDINIFEYNYIQKSNKWYDIQVSSDIVADDNFNIILNDLFTEEGRNLNSIKVYSSETEPTAATEDMIIYNNNIYYRKKDEEQNTSLEVSEDTIILLTSFRTLEDQSDNYLTTITKDTLTTFGIQISFEDQWYISSYQYNQELSINSLTNLSGNFIKIEQQYIPQPNIKTLENTVYGTNVSGLPQYNGTVAWEYLDSWNIELEINEILREDEEASLGVDYNEIQLINSTLEYETDVLNFFYSSDEEGNLNWYLNNNQISEEQITNLGITITNAIDGDSFILSLNKTYIRDDIQLSQEDFYQEITSSGNIKKYNFNSTSSAAWTQQLGQELSGNDNFSYNHIEGKNNTAIGQLQHIEGTDNINSANVTYPNHIEGFSNKNIQGYDNHIEGMYNKNTGDFNHLEGQFNTISQGSCISIGGSNNSFEGGQYSTIYGLQNEAKGVNYCAVFGQGNGLYGSTDTLITGYYNKAYSDNRSIISGMLNKLGDESGGSSYQCIVNGQNNQVYGANNIVSGQNGEINGSNNLCLINGTTIRGRNNVALEESGGIGGNYSFVHGRSNKINYDEENKKYTYNGDENFVVGDNNTVTGSYIRVLGTGNKVSGQNDFIVGSINDINSYNIIALGNNLSSPVEAGSSSSQTILGHYNLNDKPYLLSVGNGTADKLSNAFIVDYDGTVKASNQIIDGNGVIVGASISADRIEEIWDTVFG